MNKKIVLTIGLYMLALCSCANTDGSNSEDSGTIQKTEDSKTVAAGGAFSNGTSNYIENENGCYLTKESVIQYYDEIYEEKLLDSVTNIYFVDYDTKYEMPLCNNAECEHDTMNCIANVNNYVNNTMCANGDYLYFFAYEDVFSDDDRKLVERYNKGENKQQLGVSEVEYFEDTYLWRIKKDGTKKDRLLKIASIMNTFQFLSEEDKVNQNNIDFKENVIFSNVTTYENKLYFTYYVGGNVNLIEYDLAKDKLNELWKENDEGRVKLRNNMSDGYLWFQIQHMSAGKYMADIYAYSVRSGETKTIIKDIKDARGHGMGADGDRMYYSSENRMWTLTYDKTETEVLCEYENKDKTYYSPMPWKDYLIVNRMDCIEIYDKKANKVGEIKFDLFDVSHGGEMMQPYFIMIGTDNSDNGIVYYNNGMDLTNDRYYKFNITDAMDGKVTFNAVSE